MSCSGINFRKIHGAVQYLCALYRFHSILAVVVVVAQNDKNKMARRKLIQKVGFVFNCFLVVVHQCGKYIKGV